MVWRMVDRADVVLEVVDARFPSICRSNRLERKVLEKEGVDLLIALNKSDLIPRELLNRWAEWFRDHEGIRAVGVSAKERLGTSRIRQEILRKSSKKSAIVAIVGFPNTGKSSLINTLKGRKSAPTAPVAGHTKALQKIRVSNSLMMFDTPGILPMQLPEKHKFLLGAIAISKLKDPIGAAISLYTQFEEINPGLVNGYYGIESTNPVDFLEDLARAKNRLISGGEPDIRTAALMFLKDHTRAKIPIYEDIENPLRYEEEY
jgi:ribosome biogenesis GTPase A